LFSQAKQKHLITGKSVEKEMETKKDLLPESTGIIITGAEMLEMDLGTVITNTITGMQRQLPNRT